MASKYSYGMHEFNEEIASLADEVLAYSLERLKVDPPLDGSSTFEDLFDKVGNTITEEGMGGHNALNIFKKFLAPACISTDHPRYLSFIPSAPSEHASLFDLVVGASALYGGSWLEGSGAIFAENQALRWIADLAGFPSESGGVFVQGGTIGNLSALVTARKRAREKAEVAGSSGFNLAGRYVIVASEEAHSSIKSAAEVMDVDLLLVKTNDSRKMTGSNLEEAMLRHRSSFPNDVIFAIVATAGTTNLGIVDDIKSISEVALNWDIWLHVDGAYGLAALCSPAKKELFDGIENASSFIVDPHKWLFAPFDVCALIYKDPKWAKIAHTQYASYLDTIEDRGEWNPTDYSIGLTRRTRGLPFWFSLVSNGTKAYSLAVDNTIAIANYAAELIENDINLELLYKPELSIVSFKRIGWSYAQYEEWSKKLLIDQLGFVVPSSDRGEFMLRFAIVNPYTTKDDINIILSTLK